MGRRLFSINFRLQLFCLTDIFPQLEKLQSDRATTSDTVRKFIRQVIQYRMETSFGQMKKLAFNFLLDIFQDIFQQKHKLADHRLVDSVL